MTTRMDRAGKTSILLGLGLAVGLVALERVRPLRRRTIQPVPRTAHNVAMGLGCALVIGAVEEPLVRHIARNNAARRRGLACLLPHPVRTLGAIAIMDYTFFLWHIATHKVPLLWRFHRIHHLDPDLDASTAVRFHPADMLISLPWRLLQVWASGADPRGAWLWRQFFNASILFHHSNLRLPQEWNQRLSWLLTTPEMHGIHHSRNETERNSNWSSGIGLWDRLHGTFRKQPPQSEIVIGLDAPALSEASSVPQNLVAPFRIREFV